MLLKKVPLAGKPELIMINHIVFFKLKPEIDDHKLEEMILTTRSMLLKMPEVFSVRSIFRPIPQRN